jgi:hypothetical protein
MCDSFLLSSRTRRDCAIAEVEQRVGREDSASNGRLPGDKEERHQNECGDCISLRERALLPMKTPEGHLKSFFHLMLLTRIGIQIDATIKPDHSSRTCSISCDMSLCIFMHFFISTFPF